MKVEGFLKIERKYAGNEKIRLNLMCRNKKRRGLGKYADDVEKKLRNAIRKVLICVCRGTGSGLVFLLP